MKTIIVTGATGQLGRYVIDHLIKHENGSGFLSEPPKIIGTFFSGKTYPTHYRDFETRFLDLGSNYSIYSLVKEVRPDYFINCAASPKVSDSWDDPGTFLQNNTLAVSSMLSAIQRKVPHCRFLNIGSSEEFGYPQESEIGEGHPLNPRNPYGVSKVAARQLISVYRQKYGLYAVQPWAFNFESPYRDAYFLPRKISKGVARIVKNLQDIHPIEVGNLWTTRCWQHASDVASGVWASLNQEKPIDVILCGTPHLVYDLIREAFSSVGLRLAERECAQSLKELCLEKTGQIVVTVNPSYIRGDEPTRIVGNSNLAKNLLGWERKYTFEQLIYEMVLSDITRHKL